MLRRHSLDPIHGEDELRVDGLLDPQCAVVVEGGDAVFRSNEVGAARRSAAGNEVENAFLGGVLVPGRKRIDGRGVLRLTGGVCRHHQDHHEQQCYAFVRRRRKRSHLHLDSLLAGVLLLSAEGY
jgi:hypothetical protein